MTKIGICGHFGDNHVFLDGQTIKTKIIANEIKKNFDKKNVKVVDTFGGARKIIKHLKGVMYLIVNCDHIVILPAQNALKVFAPFIYFLNKRYKKTIHYVVIGGWLPSFVEGRKTLIKQIKSFDYIYVETETMKKKLSSLGIENVVIMKNCKQLKTVDEKIMQKKYSTPFKLCTFARITPQKGVKDIIKAVEYINKKYNKTVFTLTNYGQVDQDFKKEFDELLKKSPSYITYGGTVDFNKSVEVLQNYFALVFPTRFFTEGIPGTILDAYAAGIPVICSRWESFEDVVDDAVTGYGYEFGNYAELEYILEMIGNNPQMIVDLKKNCIRKSVEYQPDKAIYPLIRRISDVE